MSQRTMSVVFLVYLITLWAWAVLIAFVPTSYISANFKDVLGLSAVTGVLGSVFAIGVFVREWRTYQSCTQVWVSRVNLGLSSTFVLAHIAIAVFVFIKLAVN